MKLYQEKVHKLSNRSDCKIMRYISSVGIPCLVWRSDRKSIVIIIGLWTWTCFICWRTNEHFFTYCLTYWHANLMHCFYMHYFCNTMSVHTPQSDGRYLVTFIGYILSKSLVSAKVDTKEFVHRFWRLKYPQLRKNIFASMSSLFVELLESTC